MIELDLHVKKYLSVFLLLVFLVFIPLLNGCATWKLWYSNEGLQTTHVIRGEADQIYMSYDITGKGARWKLTPKYSVP